MSAPREALLTYVYAVTPPAPAVRLLLPSLTGVGCRPVGLLHAPGDDPGPVAFVISDVPRPEWDEDALKARFEDLRWLEDAARSHHRVIEALAAHTTVLPLRLATLYEDHAGALEALRAQGQAFATRLARLSGHTEYGVKVYVRPAPPPEAGAPAAAASPGRAYLQARRAQRHAHEDHYRQAGLATERVAAVARRFAADRVGHPVQSGPLAAASPEENVLNDAYLVPDAQAEAFLSAVAGAAQDLAGVRVEVTGPWAPYSFAAPPPAPAAP
ncbi:gas vesicle protein GvpL/GvpF [Streptomyces sp. 3211.6]|uniref:GvpL/GvpF family gas vesicle protein n=1 Tax=Streptomyces TaxID=1883 RepID=UPI0009A4838A|nr:MULTISPECIES: GvpL/GvpF family gas vesicle protein [Streptomyces]RKT08488.1 gas vesicle protein GvpL/GvpF [Streptomyces sp. 3211.6]RPF29887.1 gas vesicle protein GvpL/GvpF [Streptomyces sp. Ag109_G2-6]